MAFLFDSRLFRGILWDCRMVRAFRVEDFRYTGSRAIDGKIHTQMGGAMIPFTAFAIGWVVFMFSITSWPAQNKG